MQYIAMCSIICIVKMLARRKLFRCRSKYSACGNQGGHSSGKPGKPGKVTELKSGQGK